MDRELIGTSDAMLAAMDPVASNIIYSATLGATEVATRADTDLVAHSATSVATHDTVYISARAATYDVTRVATDDATEHTTHAATRAAARAAAFDATYVATYAATHDATFDATYGVTHAATDAAAYSDKNDTNHKKETSMFSSSFNDFFKFSAPFFNEAMTECAKKASRFIRGGNQWSEIGSFYEFFRDVAKLDIDWSVYEPYEQMLLHCNQYAVHEDFVMISDFPTKLLVDENNQPHCEDGPFCEWSDGSAIYAIHGTYVPRWLIEFPESITLEKIEKETNLEVQRIMINRYGYDRYISESEAEEIDRDNLGLVGSGDRVLIKMKNGSKVMVCTDGSTGRTYYIAARPEHMTCKEVHEEICGFDESRIIAEG